MIEKTPDSILHWSVEFWEALILMSGNAGQLTSWRNSNLQGDGWKSLSL